jgi:hypothetical protein
MKSYARLGGRGDVLLMLDFGLAVVDVSVTIRWLPEPWRLGSMCSGGRGLPESYA